MQSKSMEQRIIKTDVGNHDGQNKCPKCGATDIFVNTNNGKLRCNFCRFEFEPEKISGMVTDISQLQGQVFGSGTQDIVASSEEVLTFQCSSCGAEVVIDTKSSTSARCHWCRNVLSQNQQIPNGSIPDVVLPFQVSLEDAKLQIEKFVKKRQFFAHPQFRKEFTMENVLGVYFPYMVVDINFHAKFRGYGEHTVKKYVRGSGSNQKTYYDVDMYQVGREFDLAIYGLTVSSSMERRNVHSRTQTNQVIDAIMPFDIENCVKYDSNYLRGFTSERRDSNVEDLTTFVEKEAKDIARFATHESLKNYDRGVRFEEEHFSVIGQQWKTAYLPVWLYSYQEKKSGILHYVAVNGRTKEIMGSVPVYLSKLILVSIGVEMLGIFLFWFVDFKYNYLFLLLGFIYYFYYFFHYRNLNARHKYESETKTELSHLVEVDQCVKHYNGVTSSRIQGENANFVSGEKMVYQVMNQVKNQNALLKAVTDAIDKNGGNV